MFIEDEGRGRVCIIYDIFITAVLYDELVRYLDNKTDHVSVAIQS